jgi:hypothetical protein
LTILSGKSIAGNYFRHRFLLKLVIRQPQVHKADQTQKPPRQMMLGKRSRNRDLKEKYKALEEQRDKALGQLLDAQAHILELTLENQRLRAQLPVSKVRHLSSPNNVT